MSFDPDEFTHIEITGANSDEYILIPDGEYPGVIKDVSFRKNRNKETGSEFLSCDVDITIDDPKVAELVKRPNPSARYGFIVDLKEGKGGKMIISTDEGDNVKLGKLRKAAGLNDPNKPFQFSMLVGKLVQVRMGTRPGSDGEVYNNIRAVAAR